MKRAPGRVSSRIDVNLLDQLTCGDIHPWYRPLLHCPDCTVLCCSVLDQFCTWAQQVVLPIFSNPANLAKFPEYIAKGEKGRQEDH